MKNRDMFLEYMSGLSEVHNKEITKTLLNIYWQVLDPYSDEECEKAFNSILATAEFFPKPVEFIKFISPPEDEKDTALLAWVEVDNAVRTIGNYASVQFSDPVIHTTIQAMGGWSTFQNADNNEWVWVKKEFMSIYPTMKKRGGHESGHLQGAAELDQVAYGRPELVRDPVVIGARKNQKRLKEN